MQTVTRGIRARCSGSVAPIVIGLLCLPVVALANDDSAPLESIHVGQPERIEVFPESFQLAGLREQVQLVVTGIYADGSLQDLTRIAEYASSDGDVVVIENSVAFPQSDIPQSHRTAEIVVRAGEKEATVAIDVSGQNKPQPVSFEYGVLAALSKQGCNSGTCHGSPSGKGGFRLSLRAFDNSIDKLTLIREGFGRRTNPLDPDQSLLLLKPLMRVSHGGGVQLRKTDPAYQVVRDWIAEGCRLDADDQPRCVRLEVYPPSGRLLKRPAHTQQLCVLAHFDDGSVRDVTELAVYTSSDEAVAEIITGGLVVGRTRGEAAVIVRYLEFIESSFITFVEDVEGFLWNDPPENNYVDELVHAKLRQLQYLPSATCTDEEFLRRVHLDVVGTLPTIEAAQSFLADESPDKRAALIDRLLERPEHAKFWALKWGDLLRMTKKQVGGGGVYKYHRWVERAIAANMPYDQFARQLLTARGSTHANPPANFYRTAADTNDCVESISQIFLGARLQCAKCHNHPFERWTQDNYYGMAAFFHRVQRKETPKPDEKFIWVSTSGEVTQPRTGQQMKPWLPGEGDVENADVDDRRELFAEWLTHPDNPYFARIEVNRIYSHLLGRGIVEPPDDFHESNPPSNAALLDALAEDFVSSGFDRKHTLRVILNSRAYQASCETNEFNRDDTKYFSHYHPRLLSAEQLLDAICDVTAVPETFASLPPGTKATQLPAPDLVDHEFLQIAGQPARQTVCQCERSTESNLGMALQFFNGPLIHNKLRDENNRFQQLIAAEADDEQIIAELHLAALSRPPTDNELQSSRAHLAAKDAQAAQRNQELHAEIADLTTVIAEAKGAARQGLLDTKLQAISEVIRGDVREALGAEADQRSEVQRYLVEKFGPQVVVSDEEITVALDDASAAIIASSSGQQNPTSGSGSSPWTEMLNNTAVGVTSSGNDGEDYWRVNTDPGAGRWRYEVEPLTSAEYNHADGWTFTVRMKVNTGTADYGNVMVLGDASNTYYYGFTTDGVFTGDPLVERGDVDTSVYNTYQMVMDPAGGTDGLLTYYVNGDSVHTQARNALAGTPNKYANFGDGNGGSAGDFQFSELTLETGQNVVPEPASMLLLGLGGLLCFGTYRRRR